MNNLFDRASRLARNAFYIIKSSASAAIEIHSADDFAHLPFGFFRVKKQDGSESLGYRASINRLVIDPKNKKAKTMKDPSPFGVLWEVREWFVLGNEFIQLDKPRAALPVVHLCYPRPMQGGMARIGDHVVVDMWDDHAGETAWDGPVPQAPDGWK